jgi:hypothetical protein
MAWVCVVVIVRTGRVGSLSTAGLAVVAAAVLAQDHPPPEVPGQLPQFLRQRHRLVEVGEELAERGSGCHAAYLLSRDGNREVTKNMEARELLSCFAAPSSFA